MVFKKIIFQNGYVALETPSRPPHPLHGKYHFKFPFWLSAPVPNVESLRWSCCCRFFRWCGFVEAETLASPWTAFRAFPGVLLDLLGYKEIQEIKVNFYVESGCALDHHVKSQLNIMIWEPSWSQSHHDLRATLLVRSCESRSLWTFPESSSRRCCSCSTKPSCAPCTESSLYSASSPLITLLYMYFFIEHSQEISNILSIWL